MNTLQAIALMLMALSLGLAYGAYAKERQMKTQCVQLIKIRDLAHKEVVAQMTTDFDKEVENWKRIVATTMKNSYKIGVEDGRLM